MFQSERPTSGEAFVPYLRRDLIEMCLEDGCLTPEEQAEFRELSELLAATVHFDFLAHVDAVKEHYAPFDPDRETKFPDENERLDEQSAEEVLNLFRSLAQRANYFEVEESDIRRCFDASTLIELRTKVNLDDFERILCFARGDVFKETEVKKWFFFRRTVRIDILRRVLLLLHYKDETYFKAGKKKKSAHGNSEPFVPGKIYLYLYKDVPKFDLELLFPNVEVGMNLKDKLMLGVPAVGGTAAVLFKTVPQLLIIAGVVLFFTAGPAWALKLGVNEEAATGYMPVLTALLGATMALGGLAFKQWSNYRKKRIQFLKDVSEQLFFRNLATNRSDFHRVLDSAQEEECKEMILVVYHLLSRRGEALDRKALDKLIEDWMMVHFGAVIDFDIEGALGNLIGRKDGVLPCTGGLVHEDPNGKLAAVPLKEAKRILDDRWDGIFDYSLKPTS